MSMILLALGLLLAAEGLLYALAPNKMKEILQLVFSMPSEAVRQSGLIAAAIGAIIIFIVGRFM